MATRTCWATGSLRTDSTVCYAYPKRHAHPLRRNDHGGDKDPMVSDQSTGNALPKQTSRFFSVRRAVYAVYVVVVTVVALLLIEGLALSVNRAEGQEFPFFYSAGAID